MSAPASPPPGLPRGLRLAAVLCVVLSAFSGFFALNEAVELIQLEHLREASRHPTASALGDPALVARISEARFAALESMREPRGLLLGALSVSCSLVFVAAWRLLRPDGMRLEGMRRMLGGATLVTAVLRTLDGAQEAVVARRMGPATAEALRAMSFFQDSDVALLQGSPWLFSVGTGVLTALLAGTYSVLAQYFRSEHVRQAIALLDGPLAEEEE